MDLILGENTCNWKGFISAQIILGFSNNEKLAVAAPLKLPISKIFKVCLSYTFANIFHNKENNNDH